MAQAVYCDAETSASWKRRKARFCMAGAHDGRDIPPNMTICMPLFKFSR